MRLADVRGRTEVLTVRVFGEDVFGDVRRLALSDGIHGPHSQDVLLLGDHTLLHAVLQILHWARVDPHPLPCPSLAHLNVIPTYGGTAVSLRRFPGNGQEVSAGAGHMQLSGS